MNGNMVILEGIYSEPNSSIPISVFIATIIMFNAKCSCIRGGTSRNKKDFPLSISSVHVSSWHFFKLALKSITGQGQCSVCL